MDTRTLLDAPSPPPPKRARALALVYASLITNITFSLTAQSSLAPFFLSLAQHADPSATKDELGKATAYHVSIASFTAGILAVAEWVRLRHEGDRKQPARRRWARRCGTPQLIKKQMRKIF